MISITGLILTFEEEANIARTLARVAWIPRVLLIDSFSSDRTVEIARAFPNVQVLQRAFDTHAMQWNYGLEQVTTDWVLTLDADYEVSDELAREIQALPGEANVAAYSAHFQYRIFGHPLRASVYPPRTVLFHRARGTYYDDGHTQRLRVDGLLGSLRGLIYHDDRKPLSHWLAAQDRYARLEAKHIWSKPADDLNAPDRLRRKIFFAPPIMFFYLLLARGLIFDGWPGWLYVAQRTIAEFLISIRLLLDRQKLEEPSD